MESKKFKNTLKLPGNKRYNYLIKKSTASKQLWSIADSGEWIYLGDNSISQLFTLWPEREFAQNYSTGIISKHEISPIELDHFLNVIIPDLIKRDIKILIFPTLDGKGVVCDAIKLRDDLQKGLNTAEK